MAIETFTRPKQWMFYSKSKRHKIAAHKVQAEERFASGQIKIPTKVLTFEDGIYRTDKKIEANAIRESHSFLIGKVREITEEELGRLNKSRAVMIKRQASDIGGNDDRVLNQLADGANLDVMEEPDLEPQPQSN